MKLQLLERRGKGEIKVEGVVIAKKKREELRELSLQKKVKRSRY